MSKFFSIFVYMNDIIETEVKKKCRAKIVNTKINGYKVQIETLDKLSKAVSIILIGHIKGDGNNKKKLILGLKHHIRNTLPQLFEDVDINRTILDFQVSDQLSDNKKYYFAIELCLYFNENKDIKAIEDYDKLYVFSSLVFEYLEDSGLFQFYDSNS